jgi:hypothetical protein
LPHRFFAGDFFVFAAGFLAAGFLAAGFLAAGFFAADFFGAAFFAYFLLAAPAPAAAAGEGFVAAAGADFPTRGPEGGATFLFGCVASTSFISMSASSCVI